jgi:hypothetical protein
MSASTKLRLLTREVVTEARDWASGVDARRRSVLGGPDGGARFSVRTGMVEMGHPAKPFCCACGEQIRRPDLGILWISIPNDDRFDRQYPIHPTCKGRGL